MRKNYKLRKRNTILCLRVLLHDHDWLLCGLIGHYFLPLLSWACKNAKINRRAETVNSENHRELKTNINSKIWIFGNDTSTVSDYANQFWGLRSWNAVWRQAVVSLAAWDFRCQIFEILQTRWYIKGMRREGVGV